MNPDDAHADLERLINLSLDGELDATGRASLEGLLAADADAAGEADAWRKLDALVRNAERVDVDGRVFLAEHRRRRLTAPAGVSRARVLRWLVPLTAAAAILIAVIFSLPTRDDNASTTIVTAPPTSPPPAIDIHHAKPTGAVAEPDEAPVIQVRFARRDVALTPPVDDTHDQARPAVFAVISAGGVRQPLPAAVAPPI
jgi:anti-sigma factor RsiW